jgi:hypothetical protein
MTTQEIIAVLRNVKFRDWKLRFMEVGPDTYTPGVRCYWEFTTVCSVTGNIINVCMPVPFLEEHRGMMEKDILQIVRNSIYEAYMHETDEFFRYKDIMIFDPHKR